MGDTDDVDHQTGVDDLVDDPIVADACPVRGLLAYQSDTTRGRGSSASRSIAARTRCWSARCNWAISLKVR